jgi:hypothetical protein
MKTTGATPVTKGVRALRCRQVPNRRKRCCTWFGERDLQGTRLGGLCSPSHSILEPWRSASPRARTLLWNPIAGPKQRCFGPGSLAAIGEHLHLAAGLLSRANHCSTLFNWAPASLSCNVNGSFGFNSQVSGCYLGAQFCLPPMAYLTNLFIKELV